MPILLWLDRNWLSALAISTRCTRVWRTDGRRWCRHSVGFNELDRALLNGEIDVGYNCVLENYSIALIGQSKFHGAGRSKDRRNDFTCNVLISGTHTYHGHKFRLE